MDDEEAMNNNSIINHESPEYNMCVFIKDTLYGSQYQQGIPEAMSVMCCGCNDTITKKCSILCGLHGIVSVFEKVMLSENSC